MLPDFLQSSFQKYKQDTDIVATWLAVKSKQHGYPVDIEDPSKPSSTSKRLKGKARKEAKEAQAQVGTSRAAAASSTKPQYTVKIKDFVSLAEFIAGCTNPVIQVPKAFATALDQAIKLRAQHNDRSRESRSEDDKEGRIAADATHSYFLGILERVREILKSRMPTGTSIDRTSQPFKASDTAESQDTEGEEEFANRFGTLALEEPSQAFLDAPGLPTKPQSEDPLQTSYEAEADQSQEEKYLAAHCLMNDIRNIRSFVRQRWTNCAEQQLSLVSVSVATNTAISLVRDMEEEFATRFPGTSGYEDICGPFYQVQCLIRGESAETKERHDDLINFKVYDLAEDCLVTTYTTLSSLQDVVKPGAVPVYKQGRFGFRDKSKTWEKMTPRGKFKDDQLILFEAFPDLVLLSMITSRSPLAEDELIRGIRAMLPGRPMPLWLVFAGRCFLDIQHTLNDAVGNGYAHLERTARAMKSSIQMNMDFHKTLRIENWPKSNDLQFTELLGIIDNWVMQDVIAERRAKIKMNVPTQDVIAEPFFLLKQYPMICGLFTFALKARYQELCVVFINAWGSVMYAGHIYNAVRQEKLLGQAWRDMDLVIGLQSPEVLFVGNSPRSLEEYDRRFMLTMGVSVSAFANNRRKSSAVASSKGPRGLKELGPVWKLFGGRYCNNDRAVAFTCESIRPVIEGKLDDDDDDDDGFESTTEAATPKQPASKAKQAPSGSLLRKPKRNPRAMPALEFLDDIATALHAEGLDLSLDYLALHHFCWRLLRHVNDKCKPRLLEMYGGGYLEKENQLPFVVGYIFSAAVKTSMLAGHLGVKKRTGDEVTSRLLLTAAEAMEEFLREGGDDSQVKIVRDWHGYDVDFGGLPDAVAGAHR